MWARNFGTAFIDRMSSMIDTSSTGRTPKPTPYASSRGMRSRMPFEYQLANQTIATATTTATPPSRGIGR